MSYEVLKSEKLDLQFNKPIVEAIKEIVTVLNKLTGMKNDAVQEFVNKSILQTITASTENMEVNNFLWNQVQYLKEMIDKILIATNIDQRKFRDSVKSNIASNDMEEIIGNGNIIIEENPEVFAQIMQDFVNGIRISFNHYFEKINANVQMNNNPVALILALLALSSFTVTNLGVQKADGKIIGNNVSLPNFDNVSDLFPNDSFSGSTNGIINTKEEYRNLDSIPVYIDLPAADTTVVKRIPADKKILGINGLTDLNQGLMENGVDFIKHDDNGFFADSSLFVPLKGDLAYIDLGYGSVLLVKKGPENPDSPNSNYFSLITIPNYRNNFTDQKAIRSFVDDRQEVPIPFSLFDQDKLPEEIQKTSTGYEITDTVIFRNIMQNKRFGIMNSFAGKDRNSYYNFQLLNNDNGYLFVSGKNGTTAYFAEIIDEKNNKKIVLDPIDFDLVQMGFITTENLQEIFEDMIVQGEAAWDFVDVVNDSSYFVQQFGDNFQNGITDDDLPNGTKKQKYDGDNGLEITVLTIDGKKSVWYKHGDKYFPYTEEIDDSYDNIQMQQNDNITNLLQQIDSSNVFYLTDLIFKDDFNNIKKQVNKVDDEFEIVEEGDFAIVYNNPSRTGGRDSLQIQVFHKNGGKYTEYKGNLDNNSGINSFLDSLNHNIITDNGDINNNYKNYEFQQISSGQINRDSIADMAFPVLVDSVVLMQNLQDALTAYSSGKTTGKTTQYGNVVIMNDEIVIVSPDQGGFNRIVKSYQIELSSSAQNGTIYAGFGQGGISTANDFYDKAYKINKLPFSYPNSTDSVYLVFDPVSNTLVAVDKNSISDSTNSYSVVVPKGKTYGMVIRSDGYMFQGTDFDLVNINNPDTNSVMSLSHGEKIVIDQITNSYDGQFISVPSLSTEPYMITEGSSITIVTDNGNLRITKENRDLLIARGDGTEFGRVTAINTNNMIQVLDKANYNVDMRRDGQYLYEGYLMVVKNGNISVYDLASGELIADSKRLQPGETADFGAIKVNLQGDWNLTIVNDQNEIIGVDYDNILDQDNMLANIQRLDPSFDNAKFDSLLQQIPDEVLEQNTMTNNNVNFSFNNNFGQYFIWSPYGHILPQNSSFNPLTNQLGNSFTLQEVSDNFYLDPQSGIFYEITDQGMIPYKIRKTGTNRDFEKICINGNGEGYLFQVSAYRSQGNALAHLNRLKQSGISAEIKSKTINSETMYYVVLTDFDQVLDMLKFDDVDKKWYIENGGNGRRCDIFVQFSGFYNKNNIF